MFSINYYEFYYIITLNILNLNEIIYLLVSVLFVHILIHYNDK